MRVVLGIVIATVAFLTGIGIVAATEAAIGSITFGDVSIVEDERFDRDLFAVGYILSSPVDFHVRGIRLGATKSQVRAILGKPLRGDGKMVDSSVYKYDGLTIRFTSHDGEPMTADLIEITASKNTFFGLTVGSTLDEVRNRLGPPIYASEMSLSYASSLEEPINFEHDGRVVTRITAGYEDNC